MPSPQSSLDFKSSNLLGRIVRFGSDLAILRAARNVGFCWVFLGSLGGSWAQSAVSGRPNQSVRQCGQEKSRRIRILPRHAILSSQKIPRITSGTATSNPITNAATENAITTESPNRAKTLHFKSWSLLRSRPEWLPGSDWFLIAILYDTT